VIRRGIRDLLGRAGLFGVTVTSCLIERTQGVVGLIVADQDDGGD
jgi:hypothetical protein